MIAIVITQQEINIHGSAIFNRVQKTKQPAIVTAYKEPRVAIVSMDDYRELERIKQGKSAQNLLALARRARTILQDENLPQDLAERHNEYGWQG
jgi:hypothetical protein